MKKTVKFIYYVDNTGKITTKEFSIRAIKLMIAGGSAIAFIAIIAVAISVLFYFQWNKLRGELNLLKASTETAAVETSPEQPQQETVPAEARPVEMAEPKTDIVNKETPVQRKDTSMHEAQTPVIKDAIRTEEKKTEQKAAAPPEPRTTAEKIIDSISITGLLVKFDTETAQLKLSFDLARSASIESSLQGYVIILAEYSGGFSTVPEGMELKNDASADFNKGISFSIKSQKHIEHTFGAAMSNLIKKIRILVYSTNGKLLAMKDTNL